MLDEWQRKMGERWNLYGRTYAYVKGNTVQLRIMLCQLDKEDVKELVISYGGSNQGEHCWKAASDAAVEFLSDMKECMSEVRRMELAVYMEMWDLLHVARRGRRQDVEWTKTKRERMRELVVARAAIQQRIDALRLVNRGQLTGPSFTP